MIDLSTNYLGLSLKNPLVASSSPLCENLDNIRRMEDAGIAAVVLHSLFEEQITLQSIDLDHYLSYGTDSFSEALSYFPDMSYYNLGPEGYLEHIRKTKEAVNIPIVASLNGYSTGGWIKYARLMEEAGADALELNIYYVATDPYTTGQDVEQMYIDLIENVASGIKIPIAVKLSPYFSATANIAHRLSKSGARGLVLFNRFYQPDLDLDNLDVVPNLVLSTSEELRLRLRWVAILHDKVDVDLAVTGGVHTAQDVLKCMMAGANAAMMTSALLLRGIGYVSKIYMDLLNWMEENEYESIYQMQGSMSQKSVADPTAFERANYMRVLRSYAMRER
ncbi:MAG TPA: dihydroorotate dehydrogenase-like protein [Anaerolineales bacterium]|nr:dihydroorotate dehydrogenase-like protein [Anaerolineales bacterium]